MPAPERVVCDQDVRDRVTGDLGTTFLLEAGAGTGKTRVLVDRYVRCVLDEELGTGDVRAVAAITFTEKAAGELRQRVRGVYEVLGRGYSEDPALRVKQLDHDSWLVKLDLNADEYYAAEPVKRVVVRYPLRVVRFDLDPERNKWGLALDCYQGTPQKLSLPGGEP